jgi:hypothetical protein
MKQRVKYPLTPEAKEAAKMLVEAWDNKKIAQRLTIYLTIRNEEIQPTDNIDGAGRDFKRPTLATWWELSKYGLIERQVNFQETRHQKRLVGWEILLLEELRNAVENDFDVSDFFLTTSAVGTVVYGNLEVREGAIMQSQANIYGDNTQNANQLADELLELLGSDLLQSEPDLENAIVALKSVDESSRAEKCGKVIQELGHCMGHVANTATILTAISLAVQFAG